MRSLRFRDGVISASRFHIQVNCEGNPSELSGDKSSHFAGLIRGCAAGSKDVPRHEVIA